MKVLFAAAIVLFTSQSLASELRTLLLSSAYGAGAGALVGVTALAFSDNPGQNINLVARGASLGLYAGLAVGIYFASQQSEGARAAILNTPNGNLVPGVAYHLNF